MNRGRKKYLLDNPGDVLPEEFSYPLLDQIFKRHRGWGGSKQKMEIGGVEFTKTIKPVFSNSMKSKSFTITISGGGQIFECNGTHADNKRNRGKED